VSGGAGGIVRQIDHILLKTDDVRRLFELLSGPLALPVAWPLFPYRGFLSGAVSFGRVNLELLQPLDPGLPEAWRAPGTRLLGLAFEPPDVASAVRLLDERGIGHGPPEPFRLEAPGGVAAASWTTVDLDGTPECPIQLLVKYDRDQDERRVALGGQLADRDGGPLGVLSLDAVELALPDRPNAMAHWRRLLGPPVSETPPSWRLGDGPAVRLVPADSDRAGTLAIRVRSLGRARRVLHERAALGAAGAGWVALATDDGSPGVLRFLETDTGPGL